MMVKADGSRREFPVEGQRVVVGRAGGCDLRIPVASVSRRHCLIEVSDDGLRLRDLGSSNGTFRNGTRVEEATLDAGDHIEIGPVTFRVLVNGQPDDGQPVITVIPQDQHATSGNDLKA
ncbi:FHA domain-containing protein [Mucisphaera calidilacus]|nr:FHA domain-containing protein [Mucisphaera calidilacus]